MTGSNRLPVLAEEIRKQHRAAIDAATTATEHAIECGRLLAQAKESLKHGEWLPWLREHCDIAERTAQAYMRLARKVAEMGDAKSATVADLPLRQALEAISDDRAHNGLPEGLTGDTDKDWPVLWAWAGRQVNGPFNAFDFENGNLLKIKLCKQANVPSVVSFLLGVNTKIPVLRLAPTADLFTAIDRLKPFAFDEAHCRDLDIDYADFRQIDASVLYETLALMAGRLGGLIFKELDARTYDISSPAAYGSAWRADAGTVLDEWLAGIEAARRRNAKFREAGNNRGFAKVGRRIPRQKQKVREGDI